MNYLKILVLLASFVLMYKFLEIIPIEVDYFVAIGLALLAMVGTFLFLLRRGDFDAVSFYKSVLLFTAIFCLAVLIFETSPMVVEEGPNGTLYYRHISLTDRIYFVNQAIIGSALILLAYSIVKWKRKLILMAISHIAMLVTYIFIMIAY